MNRRTIFPLLLTASFAFGQESDPGGQTAESAAIVSATSVAKAHVRGLVVKDYTKLEETYAAKIMLMPGHEFLKDRFGLAGPKGRSGAITTPRANLLGAMKKANDGRAKPPGDKIDELLKTLTFKSVEVEPGDFVMDASDPVGTPDGKLHFNIKGGDVLIKVAPEKGDFLLFQLRKIKDQWKIVAEYLD